MHLDQFGKGRLSALKEIRAFLKKQRNKASDESKNLGDSLEETHKRAHLAGVKDNCAKLKDELDKKINNLKSYD